MAIFSISIMFTICKGKYHNKGIELWFRFSKPFFENTKLSFAITLKDKYHILQKTKLDDGKYI